MARCGRCRGRGEHRPIGLGPDVVCEDCGGTGEKQPPKPKKVSVSYDASADRCTYASRGSTCRGRFTWDHIVERRAITTKIAGGRNGLNPDTAKALRDALSDRRNLLPACHSCNLARAQGHPAAQPQPEDLPDGFWDFVRDYELEPCLPRWLAQEATT